MKVAVVDDEPLARSRLKRMLGAAGAEVVAEGENGEQAIKLVQTQELDALVIDINMPRLNGLDAVRQMEQKLETLPAIIFCTAHEQFAIQAFKTPALAYLLKPFSQNDLQQALEKVSKMASRNVAPQSESSATQPLVLHYQGRLQRVALSKIAFFYSSEKSVYAVMENGEEVLVDKPLKELEESYTESFVRTHRAFLVQSALFEALSKNDSGTTLKLIGLDNRIPVSRRHLKSVKTWFQK